MKYLKYYISTLTLIASFLICFLGEFYPTAFCRVFLIYYVRRYDCKEDVEIKKFSHVFLLNFPMYLNLFILFFIVLCSVFVLSNAGENIFSNNILNYFYVDLVYASQTINTLDAICLTVLWAFIGNGTVPGHELVHRKNNKFDMLIGNWLLAFSWTVPLQLNMYMVTINVGLSIDPYCQAGENIYAFIFEHD